MEKTYSFFRRALALSVAAWLAAILLAIGLQIVPLSPERSSGILASIIILGSLTWGTTLILGGLVDALLCWRCLTSVWAYMVSGFAAGVLLMLHIFPLQESPLWWWGGYGAVIAVVYWWLLRFWRMR